MYLYGYGMMVWRGCFVGVIVWGCCVCIGVVACAGGVRGYLLVWTSAVLATACECGMGVALLNTNTFDVLVRGLETQNRGMSANAVTTSANTNKEDASYIVVLIITHVCAGNVRQSEQIRT